MTMIPLRGLGSLGVVADSQSQALPIGAWGNARNVRFSGMSFEKMLEPSLEATWDADTNGSALWFQGWSDGLSTYFAIATETKLWFWRASSADNGEWVEAGGPYSPGDWQSFAWGDSCVFNNGSGAPQIFNPSTMLFEDLPGWGMISNAADLTTGDDPSRNVYARCKVIVPYKSFLVALGVTENGLYQPNTAWWSGSTALVGYTPATTGIGGPPDWDYESPGSLSGKAEIGAGDGSLKWGVVLNENLICYTDSSATSMSLVGGSNVMRTRRLFNKGVAGMHLAIEYNNKHFCVSRDQIYVHDGSTVKLIAKDRVEEEFFTRAGKGGRFGGTDIDFTLMQLVKNPDRKEISLLFDETYQVEVPTPECQPYACDAYRDTMTLIADSFWACDELISIGAGQWEVPELNGGDPLESDGGSNLSLSDESCFPGACYDSIRHNILGSGSTGFLLTSEAASWGGAVSGGGGTSRISTGGIYMLFNSGSYDSNVLFSWSRKVQFVSTGATQALHSATVSINNIADPYLRVRCSFAGKSTVENDVPLSSLGLVWGDPTAWNIELELDVNYDSWSCEGSLVVRVYADGTTLANTVTALGPQGFQSPTYTAQNEELRWCQTSNNNFTNNMHLTSRALTADERSSIELSILRNQEGYTPPESCISDGTALEDQVARACLVYNFEDDNYTWMDASVDEDDALISVSSMQYCFNPGWQVRWSDLNETTWEELETAGTRWSDFYYHGREENLYWLTDAGIYRSDQAVKKDGIKEYFVERDDIDLDDIVKQWTSHNYKHAKQVFFHLEGPPAGDEANNFTFTIGAKNNLMDDPTWRTPVVVNLNKTSASGKHKADFRATGRYLAMNISFNETGEIKMSGAELDAEEAHGR